MQRYNVSCDCRRQVKVTRTNSGDWVQHSDHASEVARLEAERDEYHKGRNAAAELLMHANARVEELAKANRDIQARLDYEHQRRRDDECVWLETRDANQRLTAQLAAFAAAGLAGPDGGPRKVLGDLPLLASGEIVGLCHYDVWDSRGRLRRVNLDDGVAWTEGTYTHLDLCYSTEAAALAAKEAK